jgi:hypothetical protein
MTHCAPPTTNPPTRPAKARRRRIHQSITPPIEVPWCRSPQSAVPIILPTMILPSSPARSPVFMILPRHDSAAPEPKRSNPQPIEPIKGLVLHSEPWQWSDPPSASPAAARALLTIVTPFYVHLRASTCIYAHVFSPQRQSAPQLSANEPLAHPMGEGSRVRAFCRCPLCFGRPRVQGSTVGGSRFPLNRRLALPAHSASGLPRTRSAVLFRLVRRARIWFHRAAVG